MNQSGSFTYPRVGASDSTSRRNVLYKVLCWLVVLLILVGGVAVSSCATTAPRADISKNQLTVYRIDADDLPTVKVSTAPGVAATQDEKDHFRYVVTDKLNERRAYNSADGDAKPCDVDIVVTRFDKGSKFARAMLTGLGQFHLDAHVQVLPSGGGASLNDFTVAKTFAWGGVYGASESIEDIEPSLAEAIAAALTGQSTQTAAATPPGASSAPAAH
jgi:hypothetical protein